MLSDFFRINLPYGIARNENGEWMAFNREYMPLGYNDLKFKAVPGENYLGLPIYTKYKRITEKFLIELAPNDHAVERDENGQIIRIFLYNDGTNPINHSTDKPGLWDAYFDKIKKLSRLKVSDK